MLDQLLNLVKEHAGDAVVNNADVPNEHNNDVIAEATKTVTGGLQNMLAGGGLQNILSLFGGQQQQQGSGNGIMSNPLVNMMVGHFAGKLMSKFGLGGNQASNVAGQLIPNVISSLISKTKDPSNPGFTVDSLLNSLTGGQAQQAAQESGGINFQDLIGQFTGGGQAGGGGLMDLVGKLAGGATQAKQQQGGGGGLMDMIKGFMK